MFKNILVPVDLDHANGSVKAMTIAQEMARAGGGKLTVISVQPIVIDEMGKRPPNYQPRLDAFLEKFGEGAAGILKLGGSISGEIQSAAEEIGADLIVMASHDPRFTDYLIGSNAAHVALHTACSVMVIR